MANNLNKLYLNDYFKGFVFDPSSLPFNTAEILSLDLELSKCEQLFLSPAAEKYLISKNEILTSFAISKAEDSNLTLKEAEEVYELVLNKREYNFLGKKVRSKIKLAKKDYERLEFYNVAKTFRELNQRSFTLADLTPEFIKKLHYKVSFGMDVFEKHLHGFTVYRSGKWRDNDSIRVGDYTPPPHEKIEKGISELLSWLKNDLSPVSIAVFHAAMYALHPFNNGNKRVCRLLEFILLKLAGLDQKNLYSTSYYYHKQKPRYYKYLIQTLDRKNLNYFTAFVLEAIVLSIVSVMKTSIEVKRSEFLAKQELDDNSRRALKPLVKREELQFKNLFKIVKGKMARQTFVNALQRAVDSGIVLKRESGRTTYYQLSVTTPEREVLTRWLQFAGKKLDFIPDDIKLL